MSLPLWWLSVNLELLKWLQNNGASFWLFHQTRCSYSQGIMSRCRLNRHWFLAEISRRPGWSNEACCEWPLNRTSSDSWPNVLLHVTIALFVWRLLQKFNWISWCGSLIPWTEVFTPRSKQMVAGCAEEYKCRLRWGRGTTEGQKPNNLSFASFKVLMTYTYLKSN